MIQIVNSLATTSAPSLAAVFPKAFADIFTVAITAPFTKEALPKVNTSKAKEAVPSPYWTYQFTYQTCSWPTFRTFIKSSLLKVQQLF
ncbi:MAG: hypothetical protein EOO92_27845 [Pedobacter sp.]|nr:MAG: hypothetical protein EOO92_27845 [Pedobacter sp.]